MASDGGITYLPHYSVCRVMVAPRARGCVACPPEVAYQVKPLTELCARVVGTRLYAEEIPGHVAKLVADTTATNPWYQYEEKERTCPSVATELKVGAFSFFPSFTGKVTTEAFSVDLETTAQRVLRFLELAHSKAELWTVENLHKTCTERYPLFMRMAAATNEPFLPPLDVALVWFSHMLQSKEYQTFARVYGVEWLSHCSVWLAEATLDFVHASSMERWRLNTSLPYNAFGDWVDACPTPSRLSKMAANLMDVLRKPPTLEQLRHPDLPVCGVQADDPRVQSTGFSYGSIVTVSDVMVKQLPVVDCEQALHLLPQMVRDDSEWFNNFVRSQGGSLANTATDMHDFVLAYQRYLFLATKYERKMEWCGFAPVPSIDLIWHTHLLQPRSYWYDVGFLCNSQPPMHKLLPVEARVPFVYSTHVSAAAELWEQEFAEPLQNLIKPGPGDEFW